MASGGAHVSVSRGSQDENIRGGIIECWRKLALGIAVGSRVHGKWPQGIPVLGDGRRIVIGNSWVLGVMGDLNGKF